MSRAALQHQLEVQELDMKIKTKVRGGGRNCSGPDIWN
jgi:hypothetical protein